MWVPMDTQVIFGALDIFTSLISIVPTNFGFSSPKPILRYDFPQSEIDRTKSLIAHEFPKDFLFGVATSAYQTEGAWNVGGKSESVWDYMTHKYPFLIKDKSNGDVATNSYFEYKEDIALVKSISANTYRISLSWPRLLPNGYNNYVNQEGVEHYNNVINEMLANGITPMVTLFHWDLPFNLQQLGGFTNPLIVNMMVDYAKIAFSLFGDRVKHWITVNEPQKMCTVDYALEFNIPGYNQSGIVDYICGYHALLANAAIYKMYNRDFRWHQNGKVGITLNLAWPTPETDLEEDVKAAERVFQWFNGWFLHPLFSDYGDYPDVMKDAINYVSHSQGFSESRLPAFTEEEIIDIKNSADFLGINFYTAKFVRYSGDVHNSVSYANDACFRTVSNPWAGDLWVKNTPWAFSDLLHRINTDYNIPEIYITENGYADSGALHDLERATYLHQHIFKVLLAMQRGVNIKGYIIWTLMDNFEWLDGYATKFGLFHVNYEDRRLRRRPKLSSVIVEDIYRTRFIRSLATMLNTTAVQSLNLNLY